MGENATVTLLFTDLVGSTALYDRLGDEVAEQLRRDHFRLLRSVVVGGAGHEVKQVGDGLMVVFGSAIDAVSCAVAMQQAVHRHNERAEERLAARIGLNMGEPIRDEDDYFGAAVNIAQRICNLASGGQIIASDLVRRLAEPRGRHRFRSLGPRALRGVREPLLVSEVVWDHEPARCPLPPPVVLALASEAPFVGREEVVDQLAAAWERARLGSRALALVTGEPGIGKTRVVAEMAAATHAQGATVLYGRCDAESPVPYQPFIESLRHFTAHAPTDQLCAHGRETAWEVARLLPELSDRLPGHARPRNDDPEIERYRLFEAVGTMLVDASRWAPLVLVLDDLHWADRPTLHLFRHLMQSSSNSPMLVIGTYRECDVGGAHPLPEALAHLRREHRFERVPLSGLDRGAAATLVQAVAGGVADQALVNVVHGETEGNAFFLLEVVRHLMEVGAIANRERGPRRPAIGATEIPDSVREVIAQRLSRLSESCRGLLAQASVLGREFSLEAVREMSELREDTLLDAVEEAADRRLVVEVQGRSEPAYAFSHALVRQTLYEGLSLPRRQRFHQRAAQAVENLAAGAVAPRAAEIATHYRLAGPLVDASTVVQWAGLAGDMSAAVFAWEDAILHWEAALERLHASGPDARARPRLLRRLGIALFISNSDYAKGVRCLEEALRCCELNGDETGWAKMHAHLGAQYCTNPEMNHVDEARRHLAAAAPVLVRDPDGLAYGYLCAGLGSVALFRLRPDEGLEWSSRAMSVAERSGNAVLWSNAAIAHGTQLAMRGRLREGLSLIERAWETANAVGHQVPAFMATVTLCGFNSFWLRDVAEGRRLAERELGSPRAAKAPVHQGVLLSALGYALVQAGELDAARGLGAPKQSAQFHLEYLLALADGRWEAALLVVRTSRTRGRRSGNRWYDVSDASRMAGVLRLLGRAAEAERMLERALPRSGEEHLPLELECRTQLGLLLAERGAAVQARVQLRRCREILANGEDWFAAATAVDLAEAVVCSAEGCVDDADTLFSAAAGASRKQGLPWNEAEALHLHGWWLLSSGDAELRLRAGALIDGAVEIHRRLGSGARWIARTAPDADRKVVHLMGVRARRRTSSTAAPSRPAEPRRH